MGALPSTHASMIFIQILVFSKVFKSLLIFSSLIDSLKISTLAHLFSRIWPLVRVGILTLFLALNYGKFQWRANAFRS